jgi:inosose dehydratase
MSTQAPKLTPENVSFGVTPTLWWNDDFINIDIGIPFEQAISEMALAGYVGCSIGHKYPTDPAVLKAALDLRDMNVSEP